MREVVSLAIPIIAIVMGLGIPLWGIYWDHQKRRLQYEERRLMIERGMTPPPITREELAPFSRRHRPWTIEDHLRRGTILTFLGNGMAVAAYVSRGMNLPGPEWIRVAGAPIVGLLGVGNLVYYATARKRQPSEPAARAAE